jgi:hypothetical protein
MAEGLVDEKAQLARDIGTLGVWKEDLLTRVAQLQREAVEHLENPERMYNLRALYQESGQWARHYFLLGATVGTFWMSVSLGVMGLRLKEPIGWTDVLSVVAWVMALIYYVHFMRLGYTVLRTHFRYKHLLDGETLVVRDDVGRFTKILTAAFVVAWLAWMITRAWSPPGATPH